MSKDIARCPTCYESYHMKYGHVCQPSWQCALYRSDSPQVIYAPSAEEAVLKYSNIYLYREGWFDERSIDIYVRPTESDKWELFEVNVTHIPRFHAYKKRI